MKKLTLFILTYFYAGMAYAQDLIPCPDGTYADPSIGCVTTPGGVVSSESNITEIILKIASTFMGLVAGVAVMLLIVGGIRYAIAAGDEERIQKAKRTILWSVIGLAVALAARFTAQFVLESLV